MYGQCELWKETKTSNSKPNIKEQATVIKHYKGNSSIRNYSFIIRKLYPKHKCYRVQAFTISRNFNLLSLFLLPLIRESEYLSSPVLCIFKYYVDSIPNSFCYSSALLFLSWFEKFLSPS